MKTLAFAPGHITGFFEPVYHPEDMARSGSCGAGASVSLGAFSEASVENSTSQSIEVYINGRKSPAPVTRLGFHPKEVLHVRLVRPAQSALCSIEVSDLSFKGRTQ